MNSEANRDKREQTREIVDGLIDVGAVWARYGLRIAQKSLEASSHTLNTTARMLGNLAESFPKEPAENQANIDTEGEASAS